MNRLCRYAELELKIMATTQHLPFPLQTEGMYHAGQMPSLQEHSEHHSKSATQALEFDPTRTYVPKETGKNFVSR
jgi:hypothetical protein